jgi:hypothetical protein
MIYIYRASHARQVKGDDPDKKGYPGPPGWGFGGGLTTPHSKILLLRKSNKGKSWMDLMMMERVVNILYIAYIYYIIYT